MFLLSIGRKLLNLVVYSRYATSTFFSIISSIDVTQLDAGLLIDVCADLHCHEIERGLRLWLTDTEDNRGGPKSRDLFAAVAGFIQLLLCLTLIRRPTADVSRLGVLQTSHVPIYLILMHKIYSQ